MTQRRQERQRYRDKNHRALLRKIQDSKISSDEEYEELVGLLASAVADIGAVEGDVADLDTRVTQAETSIAENTPVGVMLDYAGSTAPTGWLLCDGNAVSRTTYSDLFAIIGTLYGIGDGSTTFNLPDYRGRVSVGAGTGAGLSARSVGDSGGAEEHQLTETELAAHDHQHISPSGSSGSLSIAFGSQIWRNPAARTGATGGDTPHNNMQPYLVALKIIKV